jgi:thioredoxin 1
MVLSVTERTFNQEVLESSIPVLVNFEAPWCGLCRVIHPLLLQFKTQCEGEIKLVRINADENFKLSNTYRLKSLPTLLLIENGNVRQRLEGFRGRDDLLLALEEIKTYYTKFPQKYNQPIQTNVECSSL